MTYDGYARLNTKHVPEQDEGTATMWNYKADDTVQSIIDARGASQTFAYNNRHLVTGITYSAPSGITNPAPVTFAYDAAGNRTSMTDGLGSASYAYDELSRMTSETRTFTGLGTYPITYGAYNLANELTSITDPFGAQVGYTHDVAGRISRVTGSGFGNVSTYASNLQYRASGQLKQMTFPLGPLVNASYNSRLQPTSFSAPGISMTFQYFDDGRIKFSHDVFDQRFDRSYSYSHVGQLTQALSGAEARGEPVTNNRPYKEDFNFDVWGNMTSHTGQHWSHAMPAFGGAYTNNRMVGWQYDADGRNTVSNSVTSTFDAAGRLIQTSGPQRRNNPPLVLTQGFDGDGQRVKKTEYGDTTYLLRSTVLGGDIISEIYGTANQSNFGQKQRGHVYVSGIDVAQQISFSGEVAYIPSNLIRGTQVGAIGTEDPLGNDAGDEDPYLPDSGDPGFAYPHMGDMSDPGGGCTRDGIPMNCSMAMGKNRPGGLWDLFLPRLSRFRPRVDFPGTPPIASNSNTTLGSIFSGAMEGTVLGGLLNPKLDWRFIVPFTPWGSLYATPTDSGQRVPLSGADREKYESELNRLLSNLANSEPCQRFLREKLGLSANRIARAVRGQRAFDGRASTLSTVAAGLQPRKGLFADMTVQQFFTDVLTPNGAASASYANGRGATRGATIRDTYFNPGAIRAEVILHETLHSFYGSTYEDDWVLAKQLGVSKSDFDTLGSDTISTALKNAGCG